jgi:hypothetical protein
MFYWIKWIPIGFLELRQQFFPILGFWWRFKLKGSKRIYEEVPVVGMFFLKSSLGFTSGLRLDKIS